MKPQTICLAANYRDLFLLQTTSLCPQDDNMTFTCTSHANLKRTPSCTSQSASKNNGRKVKSSNEEVYMSSWEKKNTNTYIMRLLPLSDWKGAVLLSRRSIPFWQRQKMRTTWARLFNRSIATGKFEMIRCRKTFLFLQPTWFKDVDSFIQRWQKAFLSCVFQKNEYIGIYGIKNLDWPYFIQTPLKF